MPYRIEIVRAARRELDALPAEARERVVRAILALEENPRPGGVKKLKTRAQWRIRVGNYRVVYSIFDKERLVNIEMVTRRTTTTYD